MIRIIIKSIYNNPNGEKCGEEIRSFVVEAQNVQEIMESATGPFHGVEVLGVEVIR